MNGVEGRRLDGHRLVGAVEKEAERRQIVSRDNLEPVAQRMQRIRWFDRVTHRRLVETERHHGPELEAYGPVRQHAVVDVRRVLQVAHQHALFDLQALDLVVPDGQSFFEPETREVLRAVELASLAGVVKSRERDHATVGPAELLPEVVEHHRPAERCRQRRNQQRVVTPRQGARNGARRVPAEAVGDEPFLPHE